MKTQDVNKLKKVLKPIIMECIREAIFEEGVLSTLVAEVAVGIKKAPLLETKQQPQRSVAPTNDKLKSERVAKLRETKKKMLDAIGNDSYGGVDLFENTEPLSSGGNPGAAVSPQGPLSGIDPNDKGVDIGGLMSVFGNKWNALKG